MVRVTQNEAEGIVRERVDDASRASQRPLVDRLKQVTGGDVPQLLQRELWSYRQLVASTGRTELANRLRDLHPQAFPTIRPNRLDLYTFQGVEYHSMVQAEVALSEAELGRFVGEYILSDAAPAAAGALLVQVGLQLVDGRLIGVSPEQGCLTLVPVTPARFAVRENPH